MAFKLQPNPTFKASVTIPTPEGDGKIVFVFKHKGRKALKEFFASLGEGDAARPDSEALQDLLAGWEDFDAPYSPENLEVLLDNYPSAATAIFGAYHKALFEGKEKNSQR
jgi:hypothetical protein